jgi:hypothetical protein
MGLSRKRQKELKRLKRSAEDLLDEQRDALEHATRVLRDAGRQAANYAREEVGPNVRHTFDDRVRPAVASGLAVGRSAASTARRGLAEDVIPSVTGAIGSALAVLEAAKDPRVRDVVRKATKATEKYGKKASKAVAPAKSGVGPGGYIAIAVGVVAVAGIAYAAWQTLRADDELWIEDLGDPGAADIGEDDA